MLQGIKIWLWSNGKRSYGLSLDLHLDACSIIQIFGNPKKLRMFIWTKCFVSGKNFSSLIHLTSSVWRNWKSYVQINRINFLGLGIYVFNKFYCNSSNNIVKTKLKKIDTQHIIVKAEQFFSGDPKILYYMRLSNYFFLLNCKKWWGHGGIQFNVPYWILLFSLSIKTIYNHPYIRAREKFLNQKQRKWNQLNF